MPLRIAEKVAWSEGMLVMPQHFQQLERYQESLVSARLDALEPLSWGALRVEFDVHALLQGTVALHAFEGVMPDGTPLSLGPQGRLPTQRSLQGHFPASQAAVGVFLALPAARPGVNNYAVAGEELRYAVTARRLADLGGNDRVEEIGLATPNTLLVFEDEPRDGLATLKIAELVRNARGEITVSDSYVPPCLRISASPFICTRLERLLVLIVARQRALTASRRVTNDARVEFNAADVTRYLLLQALNGNLPTMHYLASVADVSPRSAFLLLSQLAGQLATFSPDVDMTKPLGFDFGDLRGSFATLFDLIERLLGATDTERFLTCVLKPHEGSRHYADLQDIRPESCARFFLAVESSLPRAQVVQEFIKRAKVASHGDMDIVLSTSVGGIGVAETLRPPPELPVKPGLVYFDVPVRENDVYWKHVWNDRNIVAWLPQSLEQARTTVKLIGLYSSGEQNAT